MKKKLQMIKIGYCFIVAAFMFVVFVSNSWTDIIPTLEETKKQDWFLKNIYERQAYLCYMRVDAEGWFVERIEKTAQIKELLKTSAQELLIPIFPTVFQPAPTAKLYYDTILGSNIKKGDKVLVVGAGSGSDAWVAWLKSQSPIYAIEINPMAIANTYATSHLARFEVRQILGDIRSIDLPEDFHNFDFVLWHMPFIAGGDILESKYHNGDDGSILKSFMELLPSLLKSNGQAIIRNDHMISRFIPFPHVAERGKHSTVYTITNK
ncbi:class I SAM-dependent methyltransferase [Candidatus Omnitrophota bacterium]